MKTIDFCPAAACADAVIRLEAVLDALSRLQREAESAPWGREADKMRRLEIISDRLLMEADAARDRLADADPVSAAGAMAQLMAAIRDKRVNDDAERERARRLEARAARFLEVVGGVDAKSCARLSGRQVQYLRPAADQPARRAISSSESS